MRPGETLIEMAHRHVAEGEAHVERQRMLIEQLSRGGLATDDALTLLQEFEGALANHRGSLSRIEQEQRSGRRDSSGNLVLNDR